jgi:hypothetical protein
MGGAVCCGRSVFFGCVSCLEGDAARLINFPRHPSQYMSRGLLSVVALGPISSSSSRLLFPRDDL